MCTLKRPLTDVFGDDHLQRKIKKEESDDILDLSDTTGSSPSTSTSTSSSAPACPICADVATNAHFGAMCCNACAAFFRRTVVLRRQYVCRRDARCISSAADQTCTAPPVASSRQMCKFCRFQRCIWSGLQMSAIVRNSDEGQNRQKDHTTAFLLKAKQATFVNRCRALIQAKGGRQDDVHLRHSQPKFSNLIESKRMEFTVQLRYLLDSQFLALGFNQKEICLLGLSWYYTWNCFFEVVNTLNNSGHRYNEVYMVDQSYFALDSKSMAELIRGQFVDNETIAKHCLNYGKRVVHAAQQFHHARLEEIELSFLMHLLALRAARRMFVEKRRQVHERIEVVFDRIVKHYKKNFDDVAVRLGGLILLVDVVENLTHSFRELATYLSLNGHMLLMDEFEKTVRDCNDVSVVIHKLAS